MENVQQFNWADMVEEDLGLVGTLIYQDEHDSTSEGKVTVGYRDQNVPMNNRNFSPSNLHDDQAQYIEDTEIDWDNMFSTSSAESSISISALEDDHIPRIAEKLKVDFPHLFLLTPFQLHLNNAVLSHERGLLPYRYLYLKHKNYIVQCDRVSGHSYPSRIEEPGA